MAILGLLQSDGTEVFFDPQNKDPFEGEPVEGNPGWRTSTWYLNYDVNYWPWIEHEEHGWQFVSEESDRGENIFIWDLGLGEWLFVNESAYRWMYLYGANPGWVWTFEGNTPKRRFFQRASDGSLFSFPAGLPLE